MKIHFSFYLALLMVIFDWVTANPKKYSPNEGSLSNRYLESSLLDSNKNKSENIEEKESKESSERYQRFGVPISYGNTGSGVQGYPGSGVGYTNPVKIDIGGIALGAIIGLGAVLIIPKLAHIFSTGYGYRSLENEMSSITELISKIDHSLEKYNIDSSSCMQRIVCSYVNAAQKNMKNGEATTTDQIIYSLANNTLFSNMLDGTAIKEAVETGREDDVEKCANLFIKCPVDRENIMKIVTSLLPS